METKQFYYIDTDKLEIHVTLKMFDSGPLPIVWNMKGMYTILRKELVEDIINLLENLQQQNRCDHQFTVNWENTSGADIKYLIV